MGSGPIRSSSCCSILPAAVSASECAGAEVLTSSKLHDLRSWARKANLPAGSRGVMLQGDTRYSSLLMSWDPA